MASFPALRNLLLVSGLVALGGSAILRALSPGGAVDESRFLDEVAPGVRFGSKTGPPPHYESAEGIVAFNTYDVVPSIMGYNGPVKTLLSMDAHGRIVGIRIVEHVETKNYVHRLETPEFLGQFLGKHAADPFELDRDIDGISRATVTVEALSRSVRESARQVGRDVLGLDLRGESPAEGLGSKTIGYALLLPAAIAGYLLTKKYRKLQRLRDVLLIAGILVVGVWVSSPLSIVHVFNAILLYVPAHALWMFAVPGVLITMAVFGRTYCGWLCPFGAMAEFIARIPTKKWVFPVDDDRRWRKMKYLVLWGVVVLVAVTGRPDLAGFETYLTLFSGEGSVLAWALVGLMLLANLRVPRFWCRYLCPVGALGGLLSRNTPGYPSMPCCPMANSPHPPGAECIRCNRCWQVFEKRSRSHE